MTSFLERVINDSNRFGKKIGAAGKSRKQIEAHMAQMRMTLLKAHRFVLDDDFVRVATEISCKTNVMEVAQRVQGAVIPYERTWIEFNPRVKVQASADILGKEWSPPPTLDTPDKMGLLIERAPGDSYAWSVTVFMPTFIRGHIAGDPIDKNVAVGEMAFPTPLTYLFDARGRNFKEASSIGRVKTFFEAVKPLIGGVEDSKEVDALAIEIDMIFGAEAWGFWAKSKNGKRDSHPVLPGLLATHAAAGVTPFFQDMLVTLKKIGHLSELRLWLDNYRVEMKQHIGLMRWLVGVLCILNEVPIQVTEVTREYTHSVRPLRNRPLSEKRFDHSVVTLKLPRVKNRVKYVSRKLIGGIRKRRHFVEEHWRTYLSEQVDAECPIDTGLPLPVRHHRWEVDHENGYRLCERCQSFGRLIREHQRGDISLGWVTKEFNVTANKKEETCSEPSSSQ
jgi:hypothetical protein